MYNTFNMGLGMIVAVDPADVEKNRTNQKGRDAPYVVGPHRSGRKRSRLMLKVVVLVSGGGTNLQAIIDGVKGGGVIRNTKIVGVISNNKECICA